MEYSLDVAETFGDVAILQKYSEVESRSLVDLTSDFNIFKLSLPVISANMPDITGPTMAVEMRRRGGLGILHRFKTIDEAIAEYKDVIYDPSVTHFDHNVGVSIGVQEADKERFEKLYEAGARIFCIDIAHGDCSNMKNIIHWINGQIFKWDRSSRNKLSIIAGNIATAAGACRLAEWGADVIKVGVGPGSVCTTRQRTGVGTPQLYALRTIRDALDKNTAFNNVKVIADGGITTVGDIAKALKYSDAVMLGSALAGTTETPGRVFPTPGTTLVNRTYYKVLAGSASAEHKNRSGQASQFVEGEVRTVPFKGHVKYILQEVREGLQSSCSYVGAFNLKEFQHKCEFVEITPAGRVESKI